MKKLSKQECLFASSFYLPRQLKDFLGSGMKLRLRRPGWHRVTATDDISRSVEVPDNWYAPSQV